MTATPAPTFSATSAISARQNPATSDNGLALRHIVKRYDGADRNVIDDVSLDVPRGNVLVIVGPSGSGKSTLLRTVAGLEPIQGGDIVLDGTVIEHGEANGPLTGRAKRATDLRTRIGMVFQSYDLFPNKTALENVMMAPMLVQKRNKNDVRAEALALLERVGLLDRADAKPHELSGGQRQRVAIVRALIMHPEVLLFDEVTAALDPEMVHEVLDVILELADSGQTMMIVTHEMAFARAIADQIVLFENGHIVETSDDPDAFFEHPITERARQFLHSFEYSRAARARHAEHTPAHESADAQEADVIHAFELED